MSAADALAGKTALVTGASSGIGLRLAERLVERGCRVALVARTEAKLHEVVAKLGSNALAIPLDVGELDKLETLPKRVVDHFGALDLVVNNAAVHFRGSMFRHEPAALAHMVIVNLAAPIVLTRAAAPLMRRGGIVVNVSSLAGKLGVPGSAVYSGTKAGLRFWALAVAEELETFGVRIANVNPGPVDTGFFDKEIEHVSNLTFSQPMSSPDDVVRAIFVCIESHRSPLDVDVPMLSGKLATLGYVLPSVGRLLRPWLERKGANNKAAYRKRKAL